MNRHPKLSPPSLKHSLKEIRAAIDLATLPWHMSKLFVAKNKQVGDGRHVFVLPGFGASDRAMLPLRYFLQRHGFKSYGWGLGINRAGLNMKYDPSKLSWKFQPPEPYRGEAGVVFLCDAVASKIRAFHNQTQEPVTLVGWSLGGTIAREVARDLPHIVDHVVTLGSPLLGGPKYTAAAKVLAKQGLDMDWIEQQVLIRNQHPLGCKATSIVSRTDGVVGFNASVIPEDENTRYIEMDVPHLAMGINRSIFAAVLSQLAD